MATLILSGGAYGANWLPLVYPLVGIVIVLYTVDFIIKFFKKRKLHKENQLMNDLSSADNTTLQSNDNTNP